MTDAPTVDGAIVFSDLVGFTEFTDARGDAAALELLERQLSVAHDAVGTAGRGRIVKEIGDGLMLWFPSASAAVTAAVALRDGVERERSRGFPLAIRLGVHAGSAIERGDDLVGHAVNVASRIADAAGPGEVLVSDDALDAAAHEGCVVRATDIGAVYVKGVTAPIWLSRL